MGRKEKKTKPPRQRKPSAVSLWWSSLEPHRRKLLLRRGGWLVATICLVAAAAVGLSKLTDSVLAGQFGGKPLAVEVRFAQCPWWMPAEVAEELCRSMTPQDMHFGDSSLARRVYETACANPWLRQVRQVRTRRLNGAGWGIVEVSAEFRQPVARVKVPGGPGDEYVDEFGVRLPAGQVPQWRAMVRDSAGAPKRWACFVDRAGVPNHLRSEPMHYVQILGIAAEPPSPGEQWQGQDLSDAIRLVKLVWNKPYFWQIAAVDVRNHMGRQSRNAPPLRMFAVAPGGMMTEMRLDRFLLPDGDYVVPPEEGLLNLDDYYRRHGTIAGLHPHIDLRLEKLNVGIN